MSNTTPQLGDMIIKDGKRWILGSLNTASTGNIFKANPLTMSGEEIEVNEDEIGEGKPYKLLKALAR